MFGLKYLGRLAFLATIALFLCAIPVHSQCSPFQGLGAVQFFGNDGTPLVNGVLYSFAAGTSTQQATFTDSTCTTQNVNPITFTTGARVNIWLTTGNFYKFQLCLQNDGSTCAPADVLFSVDNVPGGATGGSGGGGPPFTSGSPNPATTGILRCASGDQCVVFRNAANSANLAIAKDSSDVLTWASGAMKFPETSCASSSTGFDYWCADSTSHHWKFTGNGSSQFFSPGIGTAAGSGNAPKFASNGIDLVDSGIAFSQLQNYEPVIALAPATVFSGGSASACALVPVVAPCAYFSFANSHTAIRMTIAVTSAAVGCTQNAIIGIKDLTSGVTLLSSTNPPVGITIVTGSAAIPATDTIGVGLLQISTGCGAGVQVQTVSVNYQ